MTYTEDQLTGWFDVEKHKPWEPGVYEVSMRGYTPDEDGCYAWWDGVKWGQACILGFEYVEESRYWNPTNAHRIFQWRGLSKNPNAKPKRSGNKRKTMYVVQEVANNGALLRSLASFRDMKHAKRYASSVYCYTRIDKIRFRTPEQD